MPQKPEDRNYSAEYKRFHSKPSEVKRRSDRNKARTRLGKLGKVKKGDGKDVDHKDRNPSNNSLKNLRVQDPSKNRGRNQRPGEGK